MKVEGQGQLLRIYISESDRWEGRPLYEAIVRAAREFGLAGATALRGIEGFGANSRIHTVKVLRLSEDLPIVVEIADRPERVAAFMSTIDNMVDEGMVTSETVNIAVYRRENGGERPSEELQLDVAEPAPVTAGQQSPFFESTDGARKIIEAAKGAATSSRRVFIDSVDVLLAMLRESGGVAGKVLNDLRIDVNTVEQCLREEVSRDAPTDHFLISLEAKSIAEAKWLEHDFVGAEHVLLALCEIRPSAATDILMRLGAQPRDICKDVLQILDHQDDWRRWLADHPDM
jgi:PII-like signaling protein